MQLITKKCLEGSAAKPKARAKFTDLQLHCPVADTASVVVPHAKAQGCQMLRAVFADAPTGIGYVLDRGMRIQVPKQQAAQAAAIHPDDFESLALILAYPGRFTDHAGPYYAGR